MVFKNELARLNKRVSLKAALVNIGWMASERAVRMLGGVVIATVVARYLGPEQYGLLNYGLAIFLLFSVLSNLGLDQVVVKEMVVHPEGEGSLLGTSFVLKVGASAAAAALAVGSTFFLKADGGTLRLIVGVLSIAGIANSFDVIEYFFLSKTKSKYVVGTRQLSLIITSVARIIAVALKSPVIVFCWIQASEYLIGQAGLALAYKTFRSRAGKLWDWHVDWQLSRTLLNEGWPLMAASLLIMVYMRSDQVLLGMLSTPRAVGEYSAALKLSEIWYSIPSIIAASIMPRLLQLRSLDSSAYYKRLQRFYDYMAVLSILLAVGVGCSARVAIYLFYGGQYGEAAPILTIHVWTGVFFFLGVVSSQQGVHEGISRLQLMRCALGAAVNLVLNFLLIPQYGAKGSAVATLAAQGVSGYLGDYLDPRSRHMFWMKSKAYVGYSFWRRQVEAV